MTSSRSTFAIHLTLLTSLLVLVGCENKPASGLATVPMQLGNKSFTLEVADRTDSRPMA
jgi:hypothetical protein